MLNKALITNLRLRTPELSVGPSALRNAGRPGVVRACRVALKQVRLTRFKVKSRRDFLRVLDHETEKVRCQLPKGAQHWGVARKALNLFIRNVVYHRHLSAHYGLGGIERWLELPLDSQVAAGIRDWAKIGKVPSWNTVKGLTPDVSHRYQHAARRIARKKGVYSINLEYYWWPANKETPRK